jgi:hypothetical protein
VKLRVLAAPPADFSWTSDRWLVGGRESSPDEAKRADEAVREIVHLHDGVIHREWYRRGLITQRHDLNREGKATRRLTYAEGKLASREYYDRDDKRVSREVFAPDGFITESIRYQYVADKPVEVDHWSYDKGTPIRRALKRGEEYVKNGDQWVEVKRK